MMVIPLKGFWDGELIKLKEIFEQNGLGVTVASSTMKGAEGIFGIKIKPDIILHEVKIRPSPKKRKASWSEMNKERTNEDHLHR